MKRFISLFLFLALIIGVTNAISIPDFVNYCSSLKEVNVIKSNRFDLDRALNMEIETGYMYIIRDAPVSVIQNITNKLDQINDSHFIPAVQLKENGDITRVYLEQNGNKRIKKLMAVTIEDNNITILYVKGKINNYSY